MGKKIDTKELKRWEKLGSTLLQKTFVFDLYSQRMRSPDGSKEDDFFYIQAPDWVNVVAVTPEKEIVLVRQYRHGVNDFGWETPGGIIPSGEMPELAGKRELEEETGFIADKLHPIGSIHPNPAILTNQIHFFFAADVIGGGTQNLDPLEDIAVSLVPLHEIPEMIQSGSITHSLSIASLFHFLLTHGKRYGCESWCK